MNTREKVLKEALNCVNGEREKQYGNPEDNFKRIADLWSVYLTSIFEDVVFELDPIDVAKMMILFKIARSNGDQDKLDNYVDMIGYAACGAEIFENGDEKLSDTFEQVAPGTVTNKEEFKKCIYRGKDPGEGGFVYPRRNGKAIMQDRYSYYQDELTNYASGRAKVKHISLEILTTCKFHKELEELLDQEATDCAINGKKLIDCYKEIDELFDKYTPDKDVYTNVSDHITSSSRKANVNPIDVADHLTRNGHAPSEMASLLMAGKLNFDDVASYVDDVINELKKELSK